MEAAPAPNVFEVTEAEFQRRVVDRSHEVPVVVDFWAEWCAPCRALGPVLESAVSSQGGRVELAKVDVDSNPSLSARFGIQGIPAVKAFRDGRVASEFTGALPPTQVESFVAALVPSEAELLAVQATEGEDEGGLRRALELDPRQSQAAAALARLLLRRGKAEEALTVAERVEALDFAVAGLAARARLELGPGAPGDAFAAWDEGDHERALELLQEEVSATTDDDRRDRLRAVMVGIFTELGPDSPLAREHRRRLAAALS